MSNLLFITTDQQRFDTLRAYGFAGAITPNIDRLCREGTVFTRCYVTAPICVACRSTMMTGLYPSATGTNGNGSWLEEHVPTWPARMEEAGVATAAIGKMHFAPWDVMSGFGHRVVCEDKRHYYIPDDFAAYLEENGLKRPHPCKAPLYHETMGAPYYPYEKRFYPDVFIADRACLWLDEHADAPFAAWVSFIGPHDPYDPPKECDVFYNTEDMPYPIPPTDKTRCATAFRQCDSERPGRDSAVFQCDYMAATPEQQRYWRKNYMTNITIIDEGIGRILDVLERRGVLEDTVIVFTSDHGDALGDHGMVFKSFFYESMVHVPLIVRGPGVGRGQRRDQLVSTCDIVPFFFEATGRGAVMPTQGGSIGTAIADPGAVINECVFSEMQGRVMAFDGRYKLSAYDGLPCEMYDLQADPDEMNDIAADPAHAGVRAALLDRIREHMSRSINEHTRLNAKVACSRRSEINRAWDSGTDVLDMYG